MLRILPLARPAPPRTIEEMRIGLVQLHCPPGTAPEGHPTLLAIDEAVAAGAELVVLPELAACGYVLDRAALVGAQPVTDRVVAAWQDAARRHAVSIVAGASEVVGDQLFNMALVIDERGSVVGRYRKLHLFGGEQQTFDPGDLGLPLFDVAGTSIGILICYDLRFPEAMRILALRGAQVVVVPTAWVGGFDKAAPPDGRIGQVDGVLVQANLNQVWVACADQVGDTGPNHFLGRSIVVDPYGVAAAGPLSPVDRAVVVVDVDPAESTRAYERGPGISPRANRRTDVYGSLLGYSCQ